MENKSFAGQFADIFSFNPAFIFKNQEFIAEVNALSSFHVATCRDVFNTSSTEVFSLLEIKDFVKKASKDALFKYKSYPSFFFESSVQEAIENDLIACRCVFNAMLSDSLLSKDALKDSSTFMCFNNLFRYCLRCDFYSEFTICYKKAFLFKYKLLGLKLAMGVTENVYGQEFVTFDVLTNNCFSALFSSLQAFLNEKSTAAKEFAFSKEYRNDLFSSLFPTIDFADSLDSATVWALFIVSSYSFERIKSLLDYCSLDGELDDTSPVLFLEALKSLCLTSNAESMLIYAPVECKSFFEDAFSIEDFLVLKKPLSVFEKDSYALFFKDDESSFSSLAKLQELVSLL